MTRALVLSGGGPIGIGWHSGMVAAFTDAGIQIGAADLFIGTSAGAVVGAQIALGRKPLDEMNRIVDVKPESGYASSIGENMQRLMTLMASSDDMAPAERLRKLGELSLDAKTAPEESFVRRFEHLSTDGWPARFVCTAIDTAGGSFTVWDGAAGVDPARAVASSCSVPGFFPPITIGGSRYMDGGLRSITNADLAAGHDRVLILTLFEPPEDSDDPRAVRVRKVLDAELDAIASKGGTSLVLAPDEQAQAVIGVNLMDPTRAKDAADAGHAQGERIARRVAELWDDA
jgi:NTE family protein